MKNLASWSLRWLIPIFFGIGLLVGLILAGAWTSDLLSAQIWSSARQQALQTARLAALQVSGDAHAGLKTIRQTSSPEYQAELAALRQITTANPAVLQIRTLRIIQGRAFVVLDAETVPEKALNMLDSVPEVDAESIAQMGTMTQGFTAERLGEVDGTPVILAYAPVYTSAGTLDAILMLGMSAEDAQNQVRLMLLALLTAGGMLTVLNLAAAGWFGGWLTGYLDRAAQSGAVQGTGSVSTPIREINQLTGAAAARTLQTPAGQVADYEDETTALRTQTQLLQVQTQMMMQSLESIHKASTIAAAASTELDLGTIPGLIVEMLLSQFDLDFAGFYILQPGSDWLEERSVRGFDKLGQGVQITFGEGLVGRAAETQKAQVDAPAAGMSGWSAAAIPMAAGGQTLGVILLQTEKGDYFNEQIVSIFQAMADQVAVAYRNALLFASKQADLDALQESYRQVTQAAWQQLLETRGVIGYTANEMGVEPAHEFSAQGKLQRNPVVVRGKVIGHLEASLPAGRPEWSQEEIDLLNTLSVQISSALDNARLYSATQRSAEREKLLTEITGKVRASTSVDAILQTAVRQLAEVLNASRGAIRLRPSEGEVIEGGRGEEANQ